MGGGKLVQLAWAATNAPTPEKAVLGPAEAMLCGTARPNRHRVGWGAAERCGNQGGDTYYKSGCCTTPCVMHDNWVPLTTAFDKADGTAQSELVPIVP